MGCCIFSDEMARVSGESPIEDCGDGSSRGNGVGQRFQKAVFVAGKEERRWVR